MSQVDSMPFKLERVPGLPQIDSPPDCALMTDFFIHAHAACGVDECIEVDAGLLDVESKKLVSTIIMIFS